MIKGIYHSAAGMVPRFMKLTAISNNLANSNTTAFKADKVHFTSTLNNELVQQGEKGIPARSIDREMTYQTDFRQGSLEQTQVPTQFALNGKGFFVIEHPETGERFYSRNGNFRLTSENDLVTYQGMSVLDESGMPIQIPGDQIVVAEDGRVFVDGKEQNRFMLVKFNNDFGLVKKGDSLFSPGAGNLPEEADELSIHQGYLETSNINIIQEMIDMITLNRNYESSQRVLIAQDDTLKKAVQEIGRYG